MSDVSNILTAIEQDDRKSAQFNPESGKTWATFLPSGNQPSPKDAPINPKKNSESE